MDKRFLTMIPGTVGNEYKSNAEKKVFRFLKETEKEGYAFHSVGLPEHEKKSYSEADFIVVTRNGVLCLEVKGGSVECQNGVWSFQDRYGNRNIKNEGPFDQAAGALFALKTALVTRIPWAKNISFASGVVFTDIIFSDRSVSVVPEILYDYGTKTPFSEFIDRCHNYWDKRNNRSYALLSDEQMQEIRKFIRDDLHFVPSLSNIIDTVDEELVRLTREQIAIIECLEDNSRIAVNGPAGSGKTLLAFDYAQKCARRGERVLYLVYNKMLAKYLNQLQADSSITIKHFHGLISEYIPLNPDLINEPSYYSNTLPDQFLKYISSHRLVLYDTLIIDEGQDLITSKNIGIFDKLLKNGLYDGNWVLFYDKNQNLFNAAKFDKAFSELIKYRPTRLSLSKNCRNTEPIAKFNKYCSHIDSGETLVSGDNVEFVGYEQYSFSDELDNLLDGLFTSNISISDIVILSPFSFGKSVVSSYSGKYYGKIERFNGEFSKEKIIFAPVQSFKGLDSKIVIAVDLQYSVENDHRLLLYTLISRARTLLYLLMSSESVTKVKEKVLICMGNGE